MDDDYLVDLKKWQARSPSVLAEIQPAELFTLEFADVYKHLHDDLWWRIINLHGTLCTLEDLHDFPFEYLYPPGGMEFWDLVNENFLSMSIIILHGIVSDQVADAHTMNKFKNTIYNESWNDESLHNKFQETLKDCRFNKYIDSVANRVTEIRHNAIAHRLLDQQTGKPKEKLLGVNLREIKQLFYAVHGVFGAVSFGCSYMTLAGDLLPSTVGGKPTRTCLDEVLDAILKDSDWINEPEKDKWWQELRKHKSREDMQILNKWRNRIGLPNA